MFKRNKTNEALELKKAEVEKERLRGINLEKSYRLIQELRINEKKPQYFTAPELPNGVVPQGETMAIAMDSECSSNAYAYINGGNAQFFPMFEGYPKLAYLAQSNDYWATIEALSLNMTREWGEWTSEDDQERAKILNDAFNEFGIKDLFRQHIQNEAVFGRSQIFIDLGEEDNSLPLIISARNLTKGCLKGLKVIEPQWTTPNVYNASYPLREDYYKPKSWFVMGEEVHSDRLLTMVNRPVSDMYKPSYNFSGLSFIQLSQPFVERWQAGVDSVARLLQNFSISGIKTDLSTILSDGSDDASQVLMRGYLFNKQKDNNGLMMLDKEMEEFFQFNTPLTGLADILKMLQEQLGSPTHAPPVVLFGITPNGMNASSEGEIRVYYDWIKACQEAYLLWQINIIGDLLQIHLFGDIKSGMRFTFNSLYQLDDKEIAEKNFTEAQTAQIFNQAGALDAEDMQEVAKKMNDGILGSIEFNEPQGLEDEFQYP